MPPQTPRTRQLQQLLEQGHAKAAAKGKPAAGPAAKKAKY